MVTSPTCASDESLMLLEQIKYLQHEIASIQQHFLGVISVSVGVYAVILYYSLAAGEQGRLIFVILPFLFMLSFYNILKYTIKILGLQAYVRHLETTLNQAIGKMFFLWQSGLVYANGYSFLASLAQLPCIAALFFFLGYQYVRYIGDFNLFPGSIWIMSGLLIAQVFCLIAMLWGCATQYFVVLHWCRRIPETLPEGTDYFEYISGLKTMKTSFREVFSSLKAELDRNSSL